MCCGCMSVEEAGGEGGGARGGENVRVRCIHLFLLRFISFYCYFKCTFLSPFLVLSPCVKGKFKFLCFIYLLYE